MGMCGNGPQHREALGGHGDLVFAQKLGGIGHDG
jgi:hypothetical protein